MADGQGSGPATGNPSQGQGSGAGQAGNFATELIESTTGSGQGAPSASPGQSVPPQAAPGSQQATTTTLPGWTSAVPKELRSDARFSAWSAKYANFGDAVKSALELESKIGGMVSIPSETSTPEERSAFLKKFGVPEKPDLYKLEPVEGVSVTPEDIKATQELFHSMDLSQKQASSIFKAMQEKGKAALEAANQARTAQATEAIGKTDAELKTEWGTEYKANLGIVKRAISAYKLSDLIKEAQGNGMIANKGLITALYELGRSIKEDHSPGSQATINSGLGERTFKY